MNGNDLLLDYRQTRSETAFAELVRLYTNLVYSVAKRRLANAALSEEVVQAVFIRLAHKPPRLETDPELAAWLHRTTVHVAVDVWRSETRRRAREESTSIMQPAPNTTDALWTELSPIIDQALDELADTDRQALTLRFFGGKGMREIGQALEVSEDAAKMRVSRALDRLRSVLASRGVACGTAALGAVLSEKAVEAAPARVVEGLRALRVPEATALSGLSLLLGSLHLISKAKLTGGVLVLLVIGGGIVTLLQSSTVKLAGTDAPGAVLARESRSGASAGAASPRSQTPVGAVSAPAPDLVRMVFYVLDGESGEGIANAKIRAVYFYAGGRGERHELVTDATGAAGLPEPREANDSGMNVFVSADGHVPKSMSFRADDGRIEYTTRLDRALSVGGRVLNAQGQPVPQVTIWIQDPGNQPGLRENVDFQTCPVTSDAEGRWVCTYIPKNFEEIRLVLNHPNYAVTLPVVPAAKANSTNLVLVLDDCFTVAGQVADHDGRPIPGANVKELRTGSYKPRSTATDANGNFDLKATAEYDTLFATAPELAPSGALVARGMAGSGSHLTVIVQAEGFAPAVRNLILVKGTNAVSFVLDRGHLFQGRIVDEAGSPIANAVVRTEADNTGIDKFAWSAKTDAEGRFVWTSAPAEPTMFWFEAPGYQIQRDVLLTADGSEQKITLKK